MNNNKNISSHIFKWMLLLLVFWGAHAWFTWELDFLSFGTRTIFRLSLAAIAFIYACKNRIVLKMSNRLTFGIVCYFIAINLPFKSIGEAIAQLVLIVPIMVLICDKKNAENNLSFLAKGLAIVFIPGFVLYFLRLTNQLNIIGYPIQYGDLNVNQTYSFMNYGFMLVRLWKVDDTRFTSVFLEPGYLGSLVAFMLYAGNYNFKKWYNVVLLICLILSFSLAGYVVSFIGYILFSLSAGKKIKRLLCLGVMTLLVLWGSQYYNNGNNMINELILSRLEYDEEKGLSGNDRSSIEADFLFSKVVSSGNVLFGDPSIKDMSGAGYKVFIVNKGLVPALLFFVFYYCSAENRKKYRYSKFFILLIALTFMQAAYPASYSWIVPFLLGINKREEYENTIHN